MSVLDASAMNCVMAELADAHDTIARLKAENTSLRRSQSPPTTTTTELFPAPTTHAHWLTTTTTAASTTNVASSTVSSAASLSNGGRATGRVERGKGRRGAVEASHDFHEIDDIVARIHSALDNQTDELVSRQKTPSAVVPLQHLSETLEDCQAMLATKTASRDTLVQKALQPYRAELDSLKASYEASRLRIQALTEENMRLTNTEEESRYLKDEATSGALAAKALLEKQVADLKATRASLTKKVADLQETNMRLQNRIDALSYVTQEKDALDKTVADQQRELEQSQAKVEVLAAKVRSLELAAGAAQPAAATQQQQQTERDCSEEQRPASSTLSSSSTSASASSASASATAPSASASSSALPPTAAVARGMSDVAFANPVLALAARAQQSKGADGLRTPTQLARVPAMPTPPSGQPSLPHISETVVEEEEEEEEEEDEEVGAEEEGDASAAGGTIASLIAAARAAPTPPSAAPAAPSTSAPRPPPSTSATTPATSANPNPSPPVPASVPTVPPNVAPTPPPTVRLPAPPPVITTASSAPTATSEVRTAGEHRSNGEEASVGGDGGGGRSAERVAPPLPPKRSSVFGAGAVLPPMASDPTVTPRTASRIPLQERSNPLLGAGATDS